MEVLVLNVTNWIGYHLTEHLLQQGYEVKGVKAALGSEHLGEFFARNSNFEWISEHTEKTFQIGICALESPDLANYELEQLFLINSDTKSFNQATVIHAPYLFGEWMPLEVDAFYEQFIEEGIYIEDFLAVFTPLLQAQSRPDEICFRPARKKEDKILEKYLPVHENSSIEEKIEQVLLHYEQFQELYPKLMD